MKKTETGKSWTALKEFLHSRPLQNSPLHWERWLPAGESLKKRQLAGKMPALPASFAEIS